MDCSDAETMIDELALDVLPGDQRAALLAHLEECAACRRLLDELSESADGLLLAAPEVVPPAGFEDRVLARVSAAQAAGAPAGARWRRPAGADRAGRAGLGSGRAGRGAGRAGSSWGAVADGPAAGRRAARVRLVAAAAAAVVLVTVGGLTGARLGGNGDGHELQTVRLISAGGATIGDVSTYGGSPAWFFMRLDGPLPNGTYHCVLDTDDGRTVAIGSLWAHDDKGGWGEHVSVDPRHVKAARLVDSGGATVATATIR